MFLVAARSPCTEMTRANTLRSTMPGVQSTLMLLCHVIQRDDPTVDQSSHCFVQEHGIHQQQQRQLMMECQQLPVLDLSVVKFGRNDAVRNLPEHGDVDDERASKDAALCFEADIGEEPLQLHPHALLQDNRCYVYKATSNQEASALQDLLSRLPEREAGDVVHMWEALLVARRDCEMMAARGVRISRDISRDWQETVSDLIDRVLLQDKELGQLKAQLQVLQQQPVLACDPAAAAGGSDELHAQLVRIRRQRDKLAREQQEMGRVLLDAQNALRLAQHDAAAAKEQLADVTAKASSLRQQHCVLLQDHIDVIRYSEQLEAAVQAAAPIIIRPPHIQQGQQAASTTSHSPRGATAAGSSDGRKSPLCGLFAPSASGLSAGAVPAAAQATVEGAAAALRQRQFGGLSQVLPQALSSTLGGGSSSPRINSSRKSMLMAAADGRGAGSAISSPRGLEACSLKAHVVKRGLAAASARLCAVDSSFDGVPSSLTDFPDTDRESLAADDQLTDVSVLAAPAALGCGKGGSRLQHAMQQLQAIAADGRTCRIPS